MSFFASLEIVFLAMLIHAFLQLVPSVFTIFYHYASGKKSSRVADDFSIFYILGVEFFSVLMFILIYLLFFNIFIGEINLRSTVFPWIMAGVLVALAILSFFAYFKKGRTTELFISRKIARQLTASAKNVKNRSDAFVLGLTTGVFELIFTLPLYILATTAIMEIDNFPRQIFGFLYIIAVVAPIMVYLVLFRRGYNLAEIERLRIKNKTFFRTIETIGYLVLACVMLIGF
ncbi:hypothetical protein IKG28_02755 [Candidatus Saccharibacteria bacterium]|nr:hypothetical protein [Candidatus Saccharibacteria bacterium]